MDNENMGMVQDERAQMPQYHQGIEEPKGSSGLAIASMVCGIVSILSCCIWVFSIVLSIVAIILGIVALNKKTSGRGMAIAGIITGVLGVIFMIVYLLFLGAIIAANGIAL